MKVNILNYLIEGLIHGLMWGIFTQFVRRKYNPGNYGEIRQEIAKRQLGGTGSDADFISDSFWGAIGISLIFFTSKVIRKYLDLT